MALKALITKGDMTTHGGTVLEGFPNDTIQDIPIAGVGHMVSCPKCLGTYPIVEGYQGWTIDGIPVALDGFRTACGARIIASQHEEFVELEDSEMDLQKEAAETVEKEASREMAKEGSSSFFLGGISEAAAISFTHFKNMLFDQSQDDTMAEPAPASVSQSFRTHPAGTLQTPNDAGLTGLGPNVDRLAAASPLAMKQIQTLKDRQGRIQWNSDSGSVTSSFKDMSGRHTVIYIDSNYKPQPVTNNDPYERSANTKNAQIAMFNLSHELGHAQHYPHNPDTSSYEACMKSLLQGPGSEGEAILNSERISAEIYQNTGVDIRQESASSDQYHAIYQKYAPTQNWEAAKEEMGQAILQEKTSNTGEPYGQYYDRICAPYKK